MENSRRNILPDGRCVSQVLDETLVHIVQCTVSYCVVEYCEAMKEDYLHYILCEQKPSGGCRRYKQMLVSIKKHVRNCQQPCRVPACVARKAELQRQRDAPRLILENMVRIASESRCRPTYRRI